MARSAARSIAEVLPEAVAAAVIDLITGDLLWAPERIGKPRPAGETADWVSLIHGGVTAAPGVALIVGSQEYFLHFG